MAANQVLAAIAANPTATNGAQPNAPNLVRIKTVLGRTGLGETAFRALVREKQAPQPIKIGRCSLWVESEISAFIEQRIRASRGGSDA